MKLWLVSRKDRVGYDEYDSAVVAAETDTEALAIHPNGTDEPPFIASWSSWATNISNVELQYIGEAAPNIKKGVICASFNAG